MYAFLNFQPSADRTAIVKDIYDVLLGTTDINLLSSGLDKSTSTIAGGAQLPWTALGTFATSLGSNMVVADLTAVDPTSGNKIGTRLRWNTGANNFYLDITFANYTAGNLPEYYAYGKDSAGHASTSAALTNTQTINNVYIGGSVNDVISVLVVSTANGIWISGRSTSMASHAGVGFSRMQMLNEGHTGDALSVPFVKTRSSVTYCGLTKLKQLVTGAYTQEATGVSTAAVAKLCTVGFELSTDSQITSSMVYRNSANNARYPTFSLFVRGDNNTAAHCGLIGNVTAGCGMSAVSTAGGAFATGQTIVIGSTTYVAIWRINTNINILVPLV